MHDHLFAALTLIAIVAVLALCARDLASCLWHELNHAQGDGRPDGNPGPADAREGRQT